MALLPEAILLLAVAVAGGWYFLHLRHQNAQQPAAVVAQPSTPPAAASKPSPTSKTSTAASPTPATASASSPAPAATAQPAAQAFDPKTLDPRQNARLKVDFDHFPSGLGITIEMNRKVYLKAETGDKAALENLYVPPGVQEFRITVRDGGMQKSSNIVSAEFLANKHMTLKVEYRSAAKGSSAGSPALDPAAQIVATLRADHFFL